MKIKRITPFRAADIFRWLENRNVEEGLLAETLPAPKRKIFSNGPSMKGISPPFSSSP